MRCKIARVAKSSVIYIMNNYSCCNSYFLIGVLISKINIFPNKQTFHIHITIMKIKNHKKNN